MAMGAGLRPKAKGLDKPPDPTVRAPALDPTGRGRLDSLVAQGLAAYLIATRWAERRLGSLLRSHISSVYYSIFATRRHSLP